MDVEWKFYENIDIGANTHVLNGAVMGIYFVISLYFEPTDVEFDRAAVLQVYSWMFKTLELIFRNWTNNWVSHIRPNDLR